MTYDEARADEIECRGAMVEANPKDMKHLTSRFSFGGFQNDVWIIKQKHLFLNAYNFRVYKLQCRNASSPIERILIYENAN